MHQTCKQCGRIQRFEFAVSDDLWHRTTAGFPYALCIECWLGMAEAAGLTSLSAGDFRFLAVVGHGPLGGTLRDET